LPVVDTKNKRVDIMSRSKQKTPVTGITTATSEKQDKRNANRKLRRCVKQRINEESDGTMLPLDKEISDVWLMGKDGKGRFDPVRHPNLMRK
jgi:hypothetical protein